MARIGLLGSYGGLNVGDEAILTSMLASLREAAPFAETVLFSRDAAHSRDAHEVDRAIDARRGFCDAVDEEISRLDVLVIGGGGLLYDGEATEYLRHVRTAHRYGVPTVAYALGAGPLTTPEDRRVVREVLTDMTRVTVRDEDSKRVLQEVGVDRPVHVVADPALLLVPEPFPADALAGEGVDTSGRMIAISVREPGGAAPGLAAESHHSTLAAVADFAVHRYAGQIVFIPMERGDVRESHAVLSHMVAPDRARVLHGSYTPCELLGLMQHMDLAVGMRLHFLIFAAISGVPFLPLPYAGKVTELARALGVPTPDSLDRAAVGPLLSALDRIWDERNEHGRRVRARTEKLKPRAAAALQHVLDLLSGPSRAAPAADGLNPEKGVRRAPVDPAGRSGAADAAPALSAARG
ncbi:polysaccharide pyruvyl transferase family protein [Geodermatophilus ruber]|uniref:Polysaccharide pyruvyl transferase CsaB n=1 Tax=Geodermatophilus ruber TaxID=504800 RepID=A0A1I4ADU7_9ACTN|nr:polysaccharide pyruvyl transferase family protein [Geodermatophilus ruber]SFK54121.1 polysaccharide pyruvyl transferase CsaB [Geodermatophilus ruber]